MNYLGDAFDEYEASQIQQTYLSAQIANLEKQKAAIPSTTVYDDRPAGGSTLTPITYPGTPTWDTYTADQDRQGATIAARTPEIPAGQPYREEGQSLLDRGLALLSTSRTGATAGSANTATTSYLILGAGALAVVALLAMNR